MSGKQTSTIFDTKQSKKSYRKIVFEERERLIELVVKKNYSYAHVSREMNISASTVKMIVKKFTEDGEIFEKKSERKLRLKEKRNQEKQLSDEKSGTFSGINIQNMEPTCPFFCYYVWPPMNPF